MEENCSLKKENERLQNKLQELELTVKNMRVDNDDLLACIGAMENQLKLTTSSSLPPPPPPSQKPFVANGPVQHAKSTVSSSQTMPPFIPANPPIVQEEQKDSLNSMDVPLSLSASPSSTHQDVYQGFSMIPLTKESAPLPSSYSSHLPYAPPTLPDHQSTSQYCPQASYHSPSMSQYVVGTPLPTVPPFMANYPFSYYNPNSDPAMGQTKPKDPNESIYS